MTYRTYEIGQRVMSKPVGCVPEFKGTIVGAYDEYVVKDPHGNLWCRSPRELKGVPGRKPKALTEVGNDEAR